MTLMRLLVALWMSLIFSLGLSMSDTLRDRATVESSFIPAQWHDYLELIMSNASWEDRHCYKPPRHPFVIRSAFIEEWMCT